MEFLTLIRVWYAGQFNPMLVADYSSSSGLPYYHDLGAGAYSQVIGPGNSGYTISYDDQYFQISAEVSFVDDLGNLEGIFFFLIVYRKLVQPRTLMERANFRWTKK